MDFSHVFILTKSFLAENFEKSTLWSHPNSYIPVGMTHSDRPVNPGDEYTIYMLGNGRARYLFCPL